MKKARIYSKELLENAISKSITWADVCRIVGVKPATGTQSHIKKVAINYGINYSHFLGKSFNRGRKIGRKRKIEEYLSNKFFIKSNELKHRLIEEGFKENKCERCNSESWCGDYMPLELDHKNSNHQDNNLDNLQIICPNCHFQLTRIRRSKKPV